MESSEREVLVAAYIERYSKENSVSDEASSWVFDTTSDLSYNDPEALWQLILDILNATDNERALGMLAASELEDLIEFHGPAFIDRIEDTAARDPKFKRLLCGVWASSTPEVWQRVLAASDDNVNDIPQRRPRDGA